MRQRADRSLERTGSSGQVTRSRGTRWPWLIVVIAVVSMVRLRPKPLLIAALVAALLATTLAPHTAVLGVALGFGAFAVLVALFFTISTLLHARRRHSAPAAGLPRGAR